MESNSSEVGNAGGWGARGGGCWSFLIFCFSPPLHSPNSPFWSTFFFFFFFFFFCKRFVVKKKE